MRGVKMKVDIYKAIGSKIEAKRWYVFVEKGMKTDFLPDKVKQAADRFSLSDSLTISQGQYRIALNTDEAISNIQKNKFHLQGVNIEIS